MNKKPIVILVVIVVTVIWLFSICNRPDCINSNPIFDRYEPESNEYRNELKNVIEQIGQDKLKFWIFSLKNIEGVHYLKLYIQSDDLCAIMFAKNISGMATIIKTKKNFEHGLGYRGARLVDVKLNIDTTGNETNFVIEKIGRILD